MIGSLRGELLDRSSGELLVEVNGVGYRVQVTPATVSEVGAEGSQVFLHVHHHQREDAETLYGFGSIDERRVFETLIGTHGVGPSLGLAILSVHSPLGLRHVLATDDVAALCLVPGGEWTDKMARPSEGPTPWVPMSVSKTRRSSIEPKP